MAEKGARAGVGLHAALHRLRHLGTLSRIHPPAARPPTHPPPQPNYDIVYPASIGKLFGAPPAQKGVLTEANLLNRILLPATVAMPTGSTISGWSYLKAASNFVLSFKVNPPLRPEQQLLHGYSYAWRPPAGCAVGPALASAAATLRARMAHISATIQAREAALAGRLPRYTLLDPREAPYYTFT